MYTSRQPPPVFGLLAGAGKVAPEEMERVFNMGVGMVAVLDSADTDRALRLLAERSVPAWVIGEITAGSGSARLTGRHPG